MWVMWSLVDLRSVLVGGAVLLCLLWWRSTRRPPGLPPGPGPALPLLGHLHLLPKDPRPQLWAWRRQYGDVVSVYLGGQLTVLLTSYAAIRQALVTCGDVFSHRPHLFAFDRIANRQGIACSSGAVWSEQRRTLTRILRDMGLGTNQLAARVQEEITHYIRAISDHQGAPVDVSRMTQMSVSNNICSIIWGSCADYDDPELLGHMDCMDRIFTLLKGTSIVHYYPVLEYIPGDPFKVKELLAVWGRLFQFIDQRIADHRKAEERKEEEKKKEKKEKEKKEEEEEKEKKQKKETKEKEKEKKKERTDVIFAYLREIRERQIRGDAETSVNDENLRMIVNDLFMTGTETTATAVQWTLLFFLHHPHVQDACFQEVNAVIGPHRRPEMSDRAKMPYLEATIWEVLRKADLIPLGIFHATSRDVSLHGYVIPKGTTVMPILTCVLQDPDIWGDPENFRPERFIGPEGTFRLPEELIVFGLGPRVCLGQSLARMELFLYLTTLIQHFRFLSPEDSQLPSLDGVLGQTNTPQPFKIRAVPRM